MITRLLAIKPRLITLCALLTFFIMIPLSQSYAQSESVTINPEHLSELIKTLESETARTEFIQNLKTLKQSAEEGDTTGDGDSTGQTLLHGSFGLDEKAEDFLDDYSQFLQKHNLNASFIGQVGLTIGAMIGALFLAFVIRKLINLLRLQLQKLKMRYGLTHNRFTIYTRALRLSFYALTLALLLYSAGVIWNVTNFNFVQSDSFLSFMGGFLNILLISFIALCVWEIINVLIEYGIRKGSEADTNRLQTLLPVIRNAMFVVFALLFTLVILSELGVDILPLLAGAGVLGIAIGFGAQTMVKDFISGFTVILEDLMQVGDVVKIGERRGRVEQITIRKIQLRDLGGIVYTIPHSEVDIIENWTKDYSYYLMEIGVAYRENPDEVIGYLEEIDEDLRSDNHFKDDILEPLEILGVDHFADSAVVIKARIKTKPIKQWHVGREFNRRMKHKFDEKGIEIPFPHQTIYFGEDKKGNAPAAAVKLQDQKEDS